MAGSMTSIDYQSDDGVTYRLRMDASNATAAGNDPADGSGPLPGGYHPRYILATHPTSGLQRKIVIGDPTSGLWSGATSTISLADFSTHPSATVAYDVFSRVGEKRYNTG